VAPRRIVEALDVVEHIGLGLAAFLARLESAKAEALARKAEPWLLQLQRVRGIIGDAGLERATTQFLLNLLQVPQSSRRAGTYRRLARVMAELGWSAVRVRGPTRGGYLEQVRGYCRLTNRDHARIGVTS
jgi:hypothetical protein